MNGREYPLRPGTAGIAPAGMEHSFHNSGGADLETVSVLAPQPGHSAEVPAAEAKTDALPTLHESIEPYADATDVRKFKLLIDPRHGSRYVTQFIGYVQKSRAPSHFHDYEEVIYILSGRGMLHVKNGDFRVEPGSCIFLPPRSEHCLENTEDETLRLLGVFCPTGSPADQTK